MLQWNDVKQKDIIWEPIVYSKGGRELIFISYLEEGAEREIVELNYLKIRVHDYVEVVQHCERTKYHWIAHL